MKRASLKAEEVTRIIITATMARPVPNALEDIIIERSGAGYPDVGFHYFIETDGSIVPGVPTSERGSYVPRYSRSSVVILLEGGKPPKRHPPFHFSLAQCQSIRVLIEKLQSMYPEAVPTLYRELFRGTNPPLEHEDYQR